MCSRENMKKTAEKIKTVNFLFACFYFISSTGRNRVDRKPVFLNRRFFVETHAVLADMIKRGLEAPLQLIISELFSRG